MSSQGGINGTAVAALLAGTVLAYSGLKGKSISSTAKALLSGQNPSGVAADPSLSIVGGDTGLSTTGATAGGSQSGTAWQPINSFLKSKGVPRAGRAGLLGNFQQESGFSPTSSNAGEGAIGYANWEGGRRTRLRNYAAQHGTVETDGNAQLGFMWLELTTNYSPVLAQLMTVPDPGLCAAIVDAQYEVSAGTERAQRVANAQALYKVIG